jgi:hypothetical protein
MQLDPKVDKSSLDKTLDEFIVKDGDVFMVEMRFGEAWPRQNSEVTPLSSINRMNLHHVTGGLSKLETNLTSLM